MKYYLAIDIGASSGRHIVGWRGDDGIVTDEIYRFPNGMDKEGESLVWNTERLFSEVKEGIKLALKKYPKIESLSIDTWGVDYVLMRGDEAVYPVYAYRDKRTEPAAKAVHAVIPFEELYSITGIQYNSFNTIYQLYADKLLGRLSGVTDFLMLPEYLMYKLTGVKAKEFTEATTTGLVNARTRELDGELFSRLGFPLEMIKPLSMPGHFLGELSDEVRKEVGGGMRVVFSATHDTASAVEALDMEENAPYISSGTWSLLGVKTESAITDKNSCESGYSNEGGVGYNRYQKNITGMWIIQELRRIMCPDTSYTDIANMASKSSFRGIFDVNAPDFMAPDNMKNAIYDYFSLRNEPAPVSDADYFNSAYVSLADGYRRAICDLETNVGREYTEIYIVGGGAKNVYLNSLTESLTGKRVRALPIEATAIGNLKMQMMADKDNA